MHFFEQPDAHISIPPLDWVKNPITFVSGAYQDISLAMEAEVSLLALRDRLIGAGVAVTELMNQGPVLKSVKMALSRPTHQRVT